MTTPPPEAEPLPTWAQLDDVRRTWADAPLSDTDLTALILAAHVQCEAYAPALAEGATVPPNYVEGEALAVHELGAAHERDGDVLGFGAEGYAVRVRPLSASVKALLRPRRAVPRLG